MEAGKCREVNQRLRNGLLPGVVRELDQDLVTAGEIHTPGCVIIAGGSIGHELGTNLRTSLRSREVDLVGNIGLNSGHTQTGPRLAQGSDSRSTVLQGECQSIRSGRSGSCAVGILLNELDRKIAC